MDKEKEQIETKTEINLIDNGWTIYLAHNNKPLKEKSSEVGVYIAEDDFKGEEQLKEVIVRIYHLLKEKEEEATNIETQ